jgi:hypothetical protein
MDCPRNITEPFRRELWDRWFCAFLGEVVNGKKLGFYELNRMVRQAEFLKLNDRMTQIRESVFERFHVNWL